MITLPLFLPSWSFNDGPLPSNVVVDNISPMESLLMIYVVDSTNDGAYTCMANNSATGTAIEDTAYISVSGTYYRNIIEHLSKCNTIYQRVVNKFQTSG